VKEEKSRKHIYFNLNYFPKKVIENGTEEKTIQNKCKTVFSSD